MHSEHGRYSGLGMDALNPEHKRCYGLGMDALVTVCTPNTNVIMVRA